VGDGEVERQQGQDPDDGDDPQLQVGDRVQVLAELRGRRQG
jgi:hypothetical protein